jgi:hypothetical protein
MSLFCSETRLLEVLSQTFELYSGTYERAGSNVGIRACGTCREENLASAHDRTIDVERPRRIEPVILSARACVLLSD